MVALTLAPSDGDIALSVANGGMQALKPNKRHVGGEVGFFPQRLYFF